MPFYKPSAGGNDPAVKIGHPGFDDNKLLIDAQESRVAQLRQDERRWSRLVIETPLDSNAKENLSNTQRKIARCVERINMARASNRKLGTVFAASGYTINDEGSLLDWALVELPSERVGYNIVS